jgi:hypothetical protein
MKTAKDIAFRMIALFIASATGVVTGAAVFAPELSVWKAAALAGLSSVFMVAQRLAQSGLDGIITAEEVSKAFGVKDA